MMSIIGCFYEHTHTHNKGLGREYMGHAKLEGPEYVYCVCPFVRPSVCLSVWNQNLVVWKQNLTMIQQGPRSGREWGPWSGPEKLSSAPRSTSSIWRSCRVREADDSEGGPRSGPEKTKFGPTFYSTRHLNSTKSHIKKRKKKDWYCVFNTHQNHQNVRFDLIYCVQKESISPFQLRFRYLKKINKKN